MFFLINIYLIRLLIFEGPKKNEYTWIITTFSIIIITKIILKTPYFRVKTEFQKKLNVTGRILSIPFNIFIRWIEHAFTLNEPFDQLFIDNYNSRFIRIFNMDIYKAKTNLYWLSYAYVVEKNEHMKDTIRNFLRLYSFTRNISTTLFILYFTLIIIKLLVVKNVDYLIITFSLIILAVSSILLIRYYYLFYNYYSKFIFRAFYYLSHPECSE